MKKKDLTKLTNEELIVEAQKRKSGYTLFKFVISIMVGLAIFTTVIKGFSFSTVLPIFFLPLAFKTKTDHEKTQNEIKSRKL